MLRNGIGLVGRRRYERASRAARRNLRAAVAADQRTIEEHDQGEAPAVELVIDLAALEQQRLWCSSEDPPPSP